MAIPNGADGLTLCDGYFHDAMTPLILSFTFEVAEFSLQSHRYVSWVIVICWIAKCGNCDSSWVPRPQKGTLQRRMGFAVHFD
jgi:hypothetical protein